MIVFLWKNGYRTGVLTLFEKAIANITTALQVGELRGEPSGLVIWATNEVYDHKIVHNLVVGRFLQEREKNGERRINEFR